MKMRVTAVVVIAAISCMNTMAKDLQTRTLPIDRFGQPVMLNEQAINYHQDEFIGKVEVAANERPLLDNTSTASKVNSATITQLLNVFSLGDDIGRMGLLTGDFNNDGKVDLVFGSPNSVNFSYFDKGSLHITDRWNSENGISSLVYVRDSSSDNHYAVFASNGELLQMDLVTHQINRRLPVAKSPSYQLTPQHLGPQQLLVHDESKQLRVVDPISFEIKATQPLEYADIVAMGSFTQKDTTQVVFSDGAIYSLVNNQLELAKNMATTPRTKVQVYDRNDDGFDELIWSEGWYNIRVYSPLTDEVVLSISTFLNIDSLNMFDIDNDGKKELIYGDGQWGSLHAIDLSNNEEKWSISNPEHGVSNVAFADFDLDGKLDVTWGAGYSSSGSDHLYIYDVQTKTMKWQSEDIRGHYNANQLADFDGDGDLDALVVSQQSLSGYGPAVAQLFDLNSKKRIYKHDLAFSSWYLSPLAHTADLDNDGKPEAVIASTSLHTIKGGNAEELYAMQMGGSDFVSGLTTADLNQDGFLEVVAGTGAYSTGSAGPVLTILDGRTGNTLKTSPKLTFSWIGFTHLVPMRGELQTDIYALLESALYSYDFSKNTLRPIAVSESLKTLTSVEINGEQSLVASTDNEMLMLGLDGAILKRFTPCTTGSITNIAPAQIGSVAVNCGAETKLFNLVEAKVAESIATDSNSKAPAHIVEFKGQNYIALGGETATIYKQSAPFVLPSPQSLSLSTHVSKALTGKLAIDSTVDYFSVEGAVALGKMVFTNRAQGEFSYQPKGVLGTDVIKFYAVKSGIKSPVAELKITITNTTPIAKVATASTHWAKAVQLNVTAVDDDQDPLQFELVTQPANGKVTMVDATKGIVKFEPSGDSIAPATFTFTAKDAVATSTPEVATVTLTNSTPQASDMTYKTYWETPIQSALKGEDADGDSLSFALIGQPSNGTVQLNEKTGLFTFATTTDADQTVSFSYVVKDKFATSPSKTVTITVTGTPKSSGGSVGIYSLVALMLLALARRRKTLN